jgi:hypothetical protein
MIILSGTSDVIRLVTTAAVALDVHASWVDNQTATATPYTPGRTNTAITTATTTTVLAAPAASTQRQLKKLMANARGGANTVTVEYFDGATAFRQLQVALLTGESIEYEDLAGWAIRDANGVLKTIGAGGGTPTQTVVSSGLTQTISGPLTNDQVVLWTSATSGIKATTIPTATGSLRYITVVDGAGTAGTAGQQMTITPVGGVVLGSAFGTTTIIDDWGAITLFDSSVNTWVQTA